MVEINNQRKAFLDMLAWSEEQCGQSENQKSWLWRHCRRRAIYWLLRHPRSLSLLKLKSTGAGRYQLLSRWWDAYRKQLSPERLLSEKSGRCGIATLRRGALPMIDRGDIRQAIDRCSNIWASLPGGDGQFEHKADNLIAQSQRSCGRTVREVSVMGRSPRLSPLWLSASSSACHGLLIITVITALPTSPARQKCQRTSWRHVNYWHADASAWCCCARCKTRRS